MNDLDPHRRLADNYLKDANDRLQFQQEYSIAAFKTLILINGGAIISLLTYIGHATDQNAAHSFSRAFIAYVGGLVIAVSAYLAAYASQANFMQDSTLRAYEQLGIEGQTTKSPDAYRKSGTTAVRIGVGLSVLSLTAFILGSVCAMSALS